VLVSFHVCLSYIPLRAGVKTVNNKQTNTLGFYGIGAKEQCKPVKNNCEVRTHNVATVDFIPGF